MSFKDLRLAICQMNIEFENKEYNLHRAEEFIQEAAGKADLILFPEMSFTGFSMNTGLTGEVNMETINYVKKLAVKYKIAIGFGWVNKNIDSENHYSVIDETGEELADYIKIHPFSYSEENEYFIGGNMPGRFKFKGFTIGITICYDLRFPELYQELSKDSQIILVPANWPEKRKYHWETLIKARAIENQSYIVGINCYGNQGELHYSGNSLAVAPDGEVLTEIIDKESMEIVTLSKIALKCREEFPVKRDRKVELYREFYI